MSIFREEVYKPDNSELDGRADVIVAKRMAADRSPTYPYPRFLPSANLYRCVTAVAAIAIVVVSPLFFLLSNSLQSRVLPSFRNCLPRADVFPGGFRAPFRG